MKMNKKVLITVSSVAIVSVLGLGIYHSNAAQAEPKLNIDEIKELVTAQYPGTITEVDIDKGFNKVIYEVEVENDGKEYEIKLDGNTGEILKLEEKETHKVKQNSTDLAITEKEKSGEQAKKEEKPAVTDDTKKSQDTNQNERVAISYDEAKKIALAEFDGIIEELDLDEDDGRYIYEIEIKNSTGEAEMDIDAYTGEIISISIDSEITNQENTTEKPAINKPSNNKSVNNDDNHDDDDYEDDDDNDDYNDNDGDNDDD